MIDRNFLQGNLQAVQDRIATTARQAGRDLAEIQLVAVTKGHSPEAIQTLVDLGVTNIGESYVAEALVKQVALAALPDVKWHMIGHVQGRKAQEVADHFQLVHSVDSLKLARRLDQFAGEQSKTLPILLECNVSGETSKSGWRVSAEKETASLLADVEQILALKNLQIKGLMSMAPVVEENNLARPYFARTRQLRDSLDGRFPQFAWKELSMGMSDDFEAAILEGATLLRIGTAILGPRPKKE